MKDVYHILGLEGSPFSPATSPYGYFRTEQSAQILQELCFGVASRKGFILLLGEVGVGKTSLLLQLLKELQAVKGLTTAWVFNTAVSRSGLLSAIIADFGLTVPQGAPVAEMIGTLHAHFLKVNASGGNCAIVIDEAHNLSAQALEALRMLSNLEAGGHKLVQIILAGQPELDERLDRPDLRQLRSRIYIHRTLQPLSKQEAQEYCFFKLSSAKEGIELKKSAFRLLWSASRGNLRMIHLVMDRVLHGLVVHGSRRITAGIMDEALKELAAHQRVIARRRARRRRRMVRLGLMGSTACLLVVAVLGGVSQQGIQTARHIASLTANLPLLGPPESKEVKGAAVAGPASKAQAGLEGSQIDRPQDGARNRYAVRETFRSGGKEPAGMTAGAGERSQQGQPREAMLQFLGPYGLEMLLPQLQQAVAAAQVSIFERALPQGLSLVQAASLPQPGGLHYSSLAWRSLTQSGPKWLLLWRPPLQMDFTRPALSDRTDILILQRMLREGGHYAGPLDGKYGKKTHRAVKSFQQQAGLKASSGLDNETLFRLSLAYSR